MKLLLAILCVVSMIGSFTFGVFLGAMQTGDISHEHIQAIYSGAVFFCLGFAACILIDVIEDGNIGSRIDPKKDEHFGIWNDDSGFH